MICVQTIMRLTDRSSFKILNHASHALITDSCSFVRRGMSLSANSGRKTSSKLRNSGHSMTLIDWEDVSEAKYSMQYGTTYLVIGHDKIYEVLDKSLLRVWLALMNALTR